MTTKASSETALLRVAMRTVARAKTLEDLRAIRANAESARQRAKLNGSGLDVRNRAAELKLRAERKAGELLSQLRLRGGDRKSNNHDDRLILANVGVTHNQSTRWQRIATIPERIFLRYLTISAEGSAEITAKGLLRFAEEQHSVGRDEAHSDNAAMTPDRAVNPLRSLRDSRATNDCKLAEQVAAQLDQLTGLIKSVRDGMNATTTPRAKEQVSAALAEMQELVWRLQAMTGSD